MRGGELVNYYARGILYILSLFYRCCIILCDAGFSLLFRVVSYRVELGGFTGVLHVLILSCVYMPHVLMY